MIIYSDPEQEKVAAVCSLQHSSEHVHDRLTLPPASMKQHAKIGLYPDTQDCLIHSNTFIVTCPAL